MRNEVSTAKYMEDPFFQGDVGLGDTRAWECCPKKPEMPSPRPHFTW